MRHLPHFALILLAAPLVLGAAASDASGPPAPPAPATAPTAAEAVPIAPPKPAAPAAAKVTTPEAPSHEARPAEAAAPSPKKTAVPPHSEVTHDVPDIDPALLEAASALQSENLVPPRRGVVTGEQTRVLQERLELARRLRTAKDYFSARQHLTDILNTHGPEEIHRSAMLELALLAQEQKEWARAQQVFSQFVRTFPKDPGVPEVLLRQGLLYRQMGANTLALAKFYSVITTALNLKLDSMDYYKRLVLQAQTEIADTYYAQARYADASEFFTRLLKLDNPDLNQPQILFKLVRSLSYEGRHTDAVPHARTFIERFPEAPELPEVRFLLADAFKKLGRNREALEQTMALLASQQSTATRDPQNWIYWQQRTGNEIANQLYKEGDYLNALEVYLSLSRLDDKPAWQWPVWYQIGLVFERLQQPPKAQEMYDRILARAKETDTNQLTPALNAVADMAKWRKEHLKWLTQAELTADRVHSALLQPPDTTPTTTATATKDASLTATP
jgi:tetratricopeptide (TPR) repeat protein